jgi:Trk-type K+ transport system membrane component
MLCNVLAMVIATALTTVTDDERKTRAKLFILPDAEKDSKEILRTLKNAKASVWIGVIVIAMLLILWIIPYYMGLYQ